MTTSWSGPSVSARNPSIVTLPEKPAAGMQEADVARLYSLATRVCSAASLDDLLNEITEFAAGTAKCDFCGAYAADGDSLVRRGGQNYHSEALQRVKLQPVAEAMHWTNGTREIAAVPQKAWSDPRVKMFFAEPLATRFESFACVPLVGGGRVVGAVNMIWRDAHPADGRDLELIAALGLLAGAEVERARLAAENAHLSEKLEARKVVERAKGILQRTLNLTEEDAYLTLQRESRQRRKSMKEVAEAIVLSEELKKKK